MPQKIDIHGVFIDPETITDLCLQKRISVYYPLFHEVGSTKTLFGRFSSSQKHILQFDGQKPYGIILSDTEQPQPSGYVVNYGEAAIERFLRGVGKAGKNIAGHIQELLKIEISGDRQYRILQRGRVVKQTSIREIPAKVRLLNGQLVDVFKSSPDYDFQGGTPYAVTDIGALSLMICTAERIYVLFGAGVDTTDEDVAASYRMLIDIYNRIQADKDASINAQKGRPLFQLPQINIQLPKVELPKLEIPQIRIQSPFVFGKKKEEPEINEPSEKTPNDSSDHK
ncbi:MAG: hypothetical protein IKR59_01375 [Lachnospiraceae bacterium]|nr:hypothetical protein [Lachnospiraceae bacterium]